MAVKPVTFTLTVEQKGRTPKVYKEKVSYEYVDANYMKIENMIRDVNVGLANRFIEEEYYP